MDKAQSLCNGREEGIKTKLKNLSIFVCICTVITLLLAFVLFHETFTWKSAMGIILITAGTLVMVI